MTFSLLAYNPNEHAWGGVAATGSLCVGGWVLRGDHRAGISASQGRAPSTLWGESVLAFQREGHAAAQALSSTVSPDPGREYRQLATLDLRGDGAAFTGDQNGTYRGHIVSDRLVVSGNILAGSGVLEAMFETFSTGQGPFEERLMAALLSAQHAGGDTRGLISAALLRVSADRPPLTLRVDMSDNPISDLDRLFKATLEAPYARWQDTVPTGDAPFRTDQSVDYPKTDQRVKLATSSSKAVPR